VEVVPLCSVEAFFGTWLWYRLVLTWSYRDCQHQYVCIEMAFLLWTHCQLTISGMTSWARWLSCCSMGHTSAIQVSNMASLVAALPWVISLGQGTQTALCSWFPQLKIFDSSLPEQWTQEAKDQHQLWVTEIENRGHQTSFLRIICGAGHNDFLGIWLFCGSSMCWVHDEQHT
jgi:hypothetical protein